AFSFAILGVTVVSIIVMILFAPSNFVSAEQPSSQIKVNPLLVLPLYNDTWKLSNAQGWIDWSPVENIFAVGQQVYSANGKELFTFGNVSKSETLADVRFSPDGSLIGFLSHSLGVNGSQISTVTIFNIKNKTADTVMLG